MASRMSPEWTLYADGGIGTHSAGAGVVARDRTGAVALLVNQRLPPCTNNEAEYAGLLLALASAVRAGIQRVEIRMDSEVVVGQMEGRFAVNSPKLKPLHSRACALAREIAAVRCVHIPRDHNALADALAAEAVAGRRWSLAVTSDE